MGLLNTHNISGLICTHFTDEEAKAHRDDVIV